METDDTMTCERVREAVTDVATVLDKILDGEKTHFLRHIRSCSECRHAIPQEVRGQVVHAVVMSLE